MKICPSCKAEYGGGEVFCPVDATRLTTPSQMAPPPAPGEDPLVGSVLADRYRILRQIGEGGMGIVYEAEHVVIEKHVALKVLRDDFSRKPEVVERFRQEAKSASRIGHQHIVDISDFGETPSGQSFFVMEMLEGEDLANVLEREATMSCDRAVNIVLQCCQALGAAHAKGIVHRDMKPENIFLVKGSDLQDFVKIVDFGIAKMSDIETPGAPGRKLTKTGMIFGTPEYMSPEQAAGKPLDHRVDIYALGVILYEMITGRVPFIGDTFMGILTQHMFEAVPTIHEANPGAKLSAELEAVIMKALSKDPDQRYQSMEELAQALYAAMDWSSSPGTYPGFGDPFSPAPALGRGVAAVPGPTLAGARFTPVRRIRKGRVAALAVVAGVLVLGGAISWIVLRPEPTTADAKSAAEPSGSADVAPAEQAASAPAPAPAPKTPPERTVAVDTKPPAEGAAVAPRAEAAAPAPSEQTAPAAPPAQVQVHVDSHPGGARVAVDGRGQVCSTTPCNFETPTGQPIQIEVRRGRAIARERITPTEAMAVELRLVAPRRRVTHRATHHSATSTGDLKVPEIFR